jgi:hypothetical protein
MPLFLSLFPPPPPPLSLYNHLLLILSLQSFYISLSTSLPLTIPLSTPCLSPSPPSHTLSLPLLFFFFSPHITLSLYPIPLSLLYISYFYPSLLNLPLSLPLSIFLSLLCLFLSPFHMLEDWLLSFVR